MTKTSGATSRPNKQKLQTKDKCRRISAPLSRTRVFRGAGSHSCTGSLCAQRVDIHAREVEEKVYTFTEDEREYFRKVFDENPEKVVEDHNAMSAVWRVSRLQEAYNKAHDIRKFEIELYWKRNNYFWLMETLMLTGLFFAHNSKSVALVILISLGGIAFTNLWICAMKGAKFWQENWEKHIDYLEVPISGKLHGSIWRHSGQHHFSVTKINNCAGYGFGFFWVIAGATSAYEMHPSISLCTYFFIFSIVQIICTFLFYVYNIIKSSSEKYKSKKFFLR